MAMSKRIKPKKEKDVMTKQFEEIFEEYNGTKKEDKKIRENREKYGKDFQ